MASQEGHEEVVRLLLQSGAQDLPAKVQEKVTHQITESGVYMTYYCSYVESVIYALQKLLYTCSDTTVGVACIGCIV